MANRLDVMSEFYREQHPLLCEEPSDDEHYSPRYYPRVRSLTSKGRTKTNLKGAAAILTRWPDHWASFLTYWWIGIGMISLTTFIIYNSLFAFSMLPSANMRRANALILTKNDKISSKYFALPEVYMHVFIDHNEVIDLNQYMPYVEIISNTFVNYKFNFIVMINDTNVDWMSAAENNHLALNELWSKDKKNLKKESYSHNIIVEHITLSAFMDNSPLRKYWRTLPHQLIEFVARAVSIWEKGGVSFNPNILTPRFHHTLYIEKLQRLLNKYDHTNKVINHPNIISKLSKPKKHRKLNNIRDIIDALESEDISTNAYSQQKLSEAENRDIQFVRHARHISTVKDDVINNSALVNTGILNKINSKVRVYGINSETQSERDIVNSIEPSYSLDIHNTSSKMSLLPLFLEYLFHNRGDVAIVNRTRKNAVLTPNPQQDNTTSKIILNATEKDINGTIYKPLLVSVAAVSNTSELDANNKTHYKESHENLEINRLSIDLKGHIIATTTACHAFLGTIFSNIVHYSDEENITDFIIAELSIFCKGLLTSCIGIDLILL